jgi:nucleoside-triphosphate--adenylate kinase
MVLKGIFRCIIIGAPASGKGTICSRIVKKFDVTHLSSGDVLRRNIEEKSQLGVEAKQFIDRGQLVPDDKMIECIESELAKVGNGSWMLDGFPRTLVQAEKFSEVRKVDAVLNLIVPFHIIMDRVQGRWVHLPSGRVYNIGFNAPKVPFHDDVTGEKLVQRVDDQPETVRKRLEIYDRMTKPVIAYYKEQGLLKDFAGNTSDEIWPNVAQFLENLTYGDGVRSEAKV